MSLTVRNFKKKLTPEGLHIARCFAVIDLGIQFSRIYGVKAPKVMFGWELGELIEENKPHIHWQKYTVSLNPQANLKKLIESWRNENLTAEESEHFKLETMLGMPCCLVIKHFSNPERAMTWAAVHDISPLPTNIFCPEIHHKFIHFDLDYYTEEDYLAVPEFIRREINLSKTG